MAEHELNKEMVDLAIRIKKHLRDHYQISIALADPDLLDKLMKLRNADDPVLQGMLSYLMALAGPGWNARFKAAESSPAIEAGAERKRLFGLYRGKSIAGREDGTPRKTAEEKQAETRYRGHQPAAEEEPKEPRQDRKPVRYYRGQPIYD